MENRANGKEISDVSSGKIGVPLWVVHIFLKGFSGKLPKFPEFLT